MNLYRIIYTDKVKQFSSLLDDEIRRLDETTFLNVMTFGIGNTYTCNEYIIDMNFNGTHSKVDEHYDRYEIYYDYIKKIIRQSKLTQLTDEDI